MNERKIYKVFYKEFKYQGYLIEETDTHFILEDFKSGEVRLPKGDTVLVEVRQK